MLHFYREDYLFFLYIEIDLIESFFDDAAIQEYEIMFFCHFNEKKEKKWGKGAKMGVIQFFFRLILRFKLGVRQLFSIMRLR